MFSLQMVGSLMSCADQWIDLINIEIQKRNQRHCVAMQVSSDIVLGNHDGGSCASAKRLKKKNHSTNIGNNTPRMALQRSRSTISDMSLDQGDQGSSSMSVSTDSLESQTFECGSSSEASSSAATGLQRAGVPNVLGAIDMNRSTGISNIHPSQLQLCQIDSQIEMLSTKTTRVSRLDWKDCKENLDLCHRGFLIARVESLESKLADTQVQLRKTRRQLKAREKECEKLQHKLNSKTTADDETLAVQKHSVKLTDRGVIALGVRKSLALTSAIGFPLASLVDTSRQTVTRCEISVWATVCARTRAFMNLVYSRLEATSSVCKHVHALVDSQSDPTCLNVAEVQQSFFFANAETTLPDFPTEKEYLEQDLGFAPAYQLNSMLGGVTGLEIDFHIDSMYCMGGTFLSGDATNSSIWRQSKLQGLLVQSSLLTNIHALDNCTGYADAFSMHTAMYLGIHYGIHWHSYGHVFTYTLLIHASGRVRVPLRCGIQK